MRSDLEAVAKAAIDWNRARLQHIAAGKAVPTNVIGYSVEEHRFRDAKSAEAGAKARLRKMCVKADPTCVVLDAEARSPRLRLPTSDVIDV